MEETLVYREIEGMEDESCSFVEDAKAHLTGKFPSSVFPFLSSLILLVLWCLCSRH